VAKTVDLTKYIEDPDAFRPHDPGEWAHVITEATYAADQEAQKGMYADQDKYEGHLIAVGVLAKKAIEAHRAIRAGDDAVNPFVGGPTDPTGTGTNTGTNSDTRAYTDAPVGADDDDDDLPDEE